MDEIAVSRFKATCLAALERVRRTGRPLRVTRFGRPLADVVDRWQQEDLFHAALERESAAR